MKIFCMLFLAMSTLLLFSCEKDNESVGGEQSPIGEVGTIVTSTSATVAGVGNIEAEVVSLSGGVSVYSGSATITNSTVKNILSNFPEFQVSGNVVTATGVKVKVTKEGIEGIAGFPPGVIVKYDAMVGDKYPVGSSGRDREVVARSANDDYPYGFYNIKVIKVEETPNEKGVKKITYWANHRFGLVGIQFDFDDGTSAKFPVYNSKEND